MSIIVFRPMRLLWASAMATWFGLALLLTVARHPSREPVDWFYFAMGAVLFVGGGAVLFQSLRWGWRWLCAFFR